MCTLSVRGEIVCARRAWTDRYMILFPSFLHPANATILAGSSSIILS